MPNGYAVNKQTLWQMEHDSTLSTPHGIVILTNESMDYDDVSAILSLAEEGHVVLVAATRGLYLWEDTMDIDYSWNSEFRIKNIGDTICCVYDQMVSCTIRDLGDSSKVVPLADYDESWWYDDGEEREWSAIAVSIPRGKGEVILVSAPLLMTNYAILNHDNGAVLIHRMMDRMKHLPVIRTESYMSATAQAEESPFYVFLHEPPLRWALYIPMLSILLFCIFTARRRQRDQEHGQPRVFFFEARVLFHFHHPLR